MFLNFKFYKNVTFFLERYPHGIFATGGAYVPTQEKKKSKEKPNEQKKYKIQQNINQLVEINNEKITPQTVS